MQDFHFIITCITGEVKTVVVPVSCDITMESWGYHMVVARAWMAVATMYGGFADKIELVDDGV